MPDGWQIVPSNSIRVEILPHSTSLEIFGIQAPANTKADHYTLYAQMEGLKFRSASCRVEILSEVDFKVQVENMAPYYNLNEPIDLDLTLLNRGNSALKVQVMAKGDPNCRILIQQTKWEIESEGNCICKMRILPQLKIDDDKQFIFISVIDEETGKILYKDTLSLRFTLPNSEMQEAYHSIPSYVRAVTLGDNNDRVSAVEWGGGGLVDPDRQRFIDFLFRLPTNNRNVIYGVDQRLFFEVYEPGFDLNLGDTVYYLSPLTQRYRYGRGAGIDLEKGRFTAGAHYTQNTFNNDFNPKESCGYLGFYPSKRLYLEGNYLHRNAQGEPTSNIASISSAYRVTERINSEFEIGKDFLSSYNRHDSSAFRAAVRGQIYESTWFDFEKIHAGSSFYGYYNAADTLSLSVDCPINSRMRSNVSGTILKQNYKRSYRCDSSFPEKEKDVNSSSYGKNDYHCTLKQRQRQYNANVSYNFLNGSSITLNGLLLRAWDHGQGDDYNFFQKWGGLTSFFPYRGWSVTGIVSYGKQLDYIKHRTQSFLQRYWISLQKQIGEKFFFNLFYEGGNTNYYDARPWRTTIGGSFGVRYSPNGFAEIFLQRVQNKPDRYEMNQISFRLYHTFSNRHHLEVSTQYFRYQRQFPNDFLFLISYTIPFSMPVQRRSDIGNVCGFVRDREKCAPVSQALVHMNGKECLTDSEGYFAFKNMKKGTHDLKVEVLPNQLITQEFSNRSVSVVGGKQTHVELFATTPCAISGEVIYLKRDPYQEMIFKEVKLELKPLAEVRVMIDRNGGEEIYTTITNEKGQFYFPKLRPGNWKVRIFEDRLDCHYQFDREELTFDLKPNEKRNLRFEAKLPEVKIWPLDP